MNEIKDSNGIMIPVSQVKCVHGAIHGKLHTTGLFAIDPEGPCYFIFETIDNKEHCSKDYADRAAAHAEVAQLAACVKEKGGKARFCDES